VSPPKYVDGEVVGGEVVVVVVVGVGGGGVVDLGEDTMEFWTRWERVEWSIPVPSMATLLFVKAEAANDLMSSTVMEWWGDAKREDPRPERKARAWDSSMACVAKSVVAA
jgi:hypothetical protein